MFDVGRMVVAGAEEGGAGRVSLGECLSILREELGKGFCSISSSRYMRRLGNVSKML